MTYAVLMEARGGCHFPWTWNYKWLCITTWMLGTDRQFTSYPDKFLKAVFCNKIILFCVIYSMLRD